MAKDHQVLALHPNAGYNINGVEFIDHDEIEDAKISRRITKEQAEAFRGIPHFEVRGPDGPWDITKPVDALASSGATTDVATANLQPIAPPQAEFIAEFRADGSAEIYTALGSFVGHFVPAPPLSGDADQAEAEFGGDASGQGQDGLGSEPPPSIVGVADDASLDELRAFAAGQEIVLDQRMRNVDKIRKHIAAQLAQKASEQS